MTRLLLVVFLVGVAGLVCLIAYDLVSAFAAVSRSEQAIRHVFHHHPQIALCIAAHESTGDPGRYNPRAVSPTGDFGLFQANYAAHHAAGETTAAFARRMFDIDYHVRWAFRLSEGGRDWSAWAWTTRRKCGLAR